MVAFRIPVEGPRLVPFGKPRLAGDKLANGRPAFRVTQTYAARDYYWNDGRLHAALDCGNFYCGDKILAAAPGRVAFVGYDAYDALGIKIEHGDGWSSEYWHLEGWKVGEDQQVAAGQVIATNGGSGLAHGVCHVHFVIRRNGVPVDPWPLITTTSPPVSAARGRCRIAGPGCNVRTSMSTASSANIYGRSLSNGYTHRVWKGEVTGIRLWSNASQYVFLFFSGEWAVVETGQGRRLYLHRSVCVITRKP